MRTIPSTPVDHSFYSGPTTAPIVVLPIIGVKTTQKGAHHNRSGFQCQMLIKCHRSPMVGRRFPITYWSRSWRRRLRVRVPSLVVGLSSCSFSYTTFIHLQLLVAATKDWSHSSPIHHIFLNGMVYALWSYITSKPRPHSYDRPDWETS
jgi:hypothetical protein